ncbi:MAG: indolepyruvate oxidoreductase subunit beta [Thermoanaerobaculales bacterium]
MEKNIILAGVGGQGILSIAYVIDNAALDAGFHFKQAEVHGMAQRGGAVQSHLRYSDDEIHSDIIPAGRADLVLSVEPLEVLRYWHFLAPGGWVVTSVTPFANIPDYPDMAPLLEELAAYEKIIMVDAAGLAKAAGSLRAQNMVTVGAASILLDFTHQQLLKYVEQLFARKGQNIVEVNRRAFSYGRAAGLFFRTLAEGGMPRLAAFELCSKIDPATLDPAHAGAWANAIGDDRNRLAKVLRTKDEVACDQVGAFV